ncbi:MAG: DUF255 domain-containing protein [Bacteroidetes bacterium]|uniref:DUF255 domain-containing protein n=1 Tax=Phaeocystidibacter marisrubri TaxID=1577780 RepID=A0A6L3ZJN6_9FLAO|nr:DUF255 domain-containing protein [Phaeocystidibacter marisrubri]KAB2818154.1 DUF255 domain-containing protein [Phaeocystidibacter marisrubri]TNE29110.1 MAG: DUF255 domain-containing protein [Bacteroidota bacterium]GGH71669.1 thioredoxin [Phaeocystidibacter marisrubri]
MKKLLSILTVFTVAFGISSFVMKSEDDTINWMSIEEAAEANENGANLPIFVDVYTDWCGWCKRLDQTTFRDPAVVAYMNSHFLNVKLDGEERDDITVKGQTFKYVASGRRGYNELPATLLNGKLSYPTVVFLNADLENLSPVPGYRQAGEFLIIAKFFGDGIYLEKTWDEYQESLQAEEAAE